jgi:hypothetical protein
MPGHLLGFEQEAPMTVNFRSKVRTWLATNCPPSMRQPATEEAIVGGGPPAAL